MNRIEVLNKQTIDKIAAGEVVSGPASVAKELIENSVDSKANAITVEIKKGGIDFLRVTDNGCGIPKDQIRTAFLRHATSKIRTIDELNKLNTLGFRGEALSSISAVSRVELISRADDDITGIRYLIEGGKETEFEEVGAPFGTTVIMRSLFYNTPARSKFLKSPASEGMGVTSFVEQLCLSHPEISFKYIVNGKVKLCTSGSGSLTETIYNVFGKEVVKELIPVNILKSHIRVAGYLGRSQIARGNRSFEIFFVNGRCVKNRILSKAVEDGYQGSLMQHRYPFAILNFIIDKEKTDINVHPAKLEVRFSSQEEIYSELLSAVKECILNNQSIPNVSVVKKTMPDTDLHNDSAAEDFETGASKNIDNTQKFNDGNSLLPKKEDIPEPFEFNRRAKRLYVPEIVEEKQISFLENDKICPEKKYDLRIIGQAFDTFILAESENKLYMIDQHAAHEKVIYERLQKNASGHYKTSQMIMPSVVLDLTLNEAELIAENMENFRKIGFELEEFGEASFRICAVPSDLYSIDVNELFVEILDSLASFRTGEPKIIQERIALSSCKAAVKGNMSLSPREREELINNLFKLEDPYHCPHGRPTMISFSRYELDRKFKRIV